jgi:small subunit ribosomal protein S4
MGRYSDSVCRLCRREGVKLFLKGTRCLSDKCAIHRREYPPGVHGQGRRRKPSDYGIQLREKQKVKRLYGVMENQFRILFHRAERAKGITGEQLLEYLECRLDNTLYRLNMASSRAQARQIVRHGQVYVNGRNTDIPSYTVRENDKIELRAGEKGLAEAKERFEIWKDRQVPEWLKLNQDQFSGEVVSRPKRSHIGNDIQEQLIVELYSK